MLYVITLLAQSIPFMSFTQSVCNNEPVIHVITLGVKSYYVIGSYIFSRHWSVIRLLVFIPFRTATCITLLASTGLLHRVGIILLNVL